MNGKLPVHRNLHERIDEPRAGCPARFEFGRCRRTRVDGRDHSRRSRSAWATLRQVLHNDAEWEFAFLVSRASVRRIDLSNCARNSAAFRRMTIFRFYARPLWSRDCFALASPTLLNKSHRRCGSAFTRTLITSQPRTHATINRATACCAG